MGKKKTKVWEPKSPPPAAPPPDPPVVPETESFPLLGYGTSYQRDYSNEQDQLRDQLKDVSPANKFPTITNYGNESYGDINLRPNTGDDNWYDDEILGLSLTELMKTLQWSNILSCAAVIVLELMVAVFRIFAPARFVLGCYLALFASLLLRVEIAQILRQHRDQMGLGEMEEKGPPDEVQDKPHDLKWVSGIGSLRKIPDVQAPVLRDNFGLLFHPSGKATMLLLMCSMCVGQNNNPFELLIGLVFAVNGFITLYLLCRYKGYREREDIPIPQLPPSPGSRRYLPHPAAAAWSYYENDASSLWKVTSTIAEGASWATSSMRDSYR